MAWVELGWRVGQDGGRRLLTIEWHERGGPTVRPPERIGFGSVLIREGLPDARVRLESPPEGVECTIELPLPDPATGQS